MSGLILLDQIPERRAPIPWLLTIPGLLLNIGFHKLQEVDSLEPAKMPDEPDGPDKISAVLKLFEIEAHHGCSNGAGGSSRHRFNLRRDLPLFQHFKHAPVCDALNPATFKDEVLVRVIMS